MDVKVISNILKCTTQEFGKIKFKNSKSNEDLERVKFCLKNINDIEIKKILILLTNSFERKIIENIGDLGT